MHVSHFPRTPYLSKRSLRAWKGKLGSEFFQHISSEQMWQDWNLNVNCRKISSRSTNVLNINKMIQNIISSSRTDKKEAVGEVRQQWRRSSFSRFSSFLPKPPRPPSSPSRRAWPPTTRLSPLTLKTNSKWLRFQLTTTLFTPRVSSTSTRWVHPLFSWSFSVQGTLVESQPEIGVCYIKPIPETTPPIKTFFNTLRNREAEVRIKFLNQGR